MFITIFSIFNPKITLTKQQESELYKKYYKPVFRTAYYCIKNKEIAKELTNEAFIIAFEKFNTLKDISNFKSWICVIALNLTKEYIKKNSKLYFIEDYDNLNLKSDNLENEIIEKIDNQEKLNKVKYALNKINQHHKEIIILRYYENMSYIEIADKLNISVGTVKSRLNRSKKEINNQIKRLEEEGVYHVV